MLDVSDKDSSDPCYETRAHILLLSTKATFIVWGQNFVADSALAAVVAGLYGNIQPSIVMTNLLQAFVRNSILGALVAMATVETMPSTRIVVVPQINAIYFIFMALPLILAVALLLLCRCYGDNGKDVPITSYDMLILGHEDHQCANVPVRQDANFPTNVNNRLVFEQTILEDNATRRVVLTTAADQDLFLKDRLLRIAVRGIVKRLKDDEQRKEWISNRISHANHGRLPTPGMSCCSYIAQMITKPGMSWSSYITQKVNDRLEFLNQAERVAWLRKAVENQYSGLMNDLISSMARAPDKSISDVIHSQDLGDSMTSASDEPIPVAVKETSTILKQPDMIQALTDSTTSAFDEPISVAVKETSTCSKHRKKIRDEFETCVVCRLSLSNNHTTKRMRAKKGCPGCQMVVCEEHWEGFNHATCDTV